MEGQSNYRRDVNGLRAIAVMAVVAFHFAPKSMPGGFAGVDIFFVISGFLITRIVFEARENFSIFQFYMARVSRIVPALGVLCICLVFFGWFALPPADYKLLSRDVVNSILFVSNLAYWGEIDYFDADAKSKWLLHTWSLSVELQFYILYPLALLGMQKIFPMRVVKLTLVIGAIAGFVFCVIATDIWPRAAYYLLPARVWEMMVGGIAYLFPIKAGQAKKYMEWSGLLFIAVTFFMPVDGGRWPGSGALMPVLGVFLFMQSGREVGYVAENIVFQNIGRWSYSIYLWHWPIFVAGNYFLLNDFYVLLGIPLSIVFGFFSYRYVEIKFTNSSVSTRFKFSLSIVVLAVAIGVLVELFSEALSRARLTDAQLNIAAGDNIHTELVRSCWDKATGILQDCGFGSGPVGAIIIGDSHAQVQVQSIAERAENYGFSIINWSLPGCATVRGIYSDYGGGRADYNCGSLVNRALEVAGSKYLGVPIVIINRFALVLYGPNELEAKTPPFQFVDEVYGDRTDGYLSNMVSHAYDTACQFAKTNPVYMVRPIPELKRSVPSTMFMYSLFDDMPDRVKISKAEYYARQALSLKMQDKIAVECGVRIIDPLIYLCDTLFCYGDDNGKPLYLDDNHLNYKGARKVAPIYDQIFNY